VLTCAQGDSVLKEGFLTCKFGKGKWKALWFSLSQSGGETRLEGYSNQMVCADESDCVPSRPSVEIIFRQKSQKKKIRKKKTISKKKKKKKRKAKIIK
jgi:hypothetical protein